MSTKADLFNILYAGDIRVDSLQDDVEVWNFLLPYRNTLYYTFDAATGSPIDLATTEALTPFNATQKSAATSILTYVSSLIGVNFVQVASGTQADIHFGACDLSGSTTAGLCSWSFSYSYTSGEVLTSVSQEAYVYLDNVEFATYNNNPAAGNLGYEVLLHEIGHAIGLGHPFDSPYPLPTAQDNTNNTVMSYTHVGAYKSTFQAYDLLALTWIYGGDGLGGNWGYNSLYGPSLNPGTDTTAPTAVSFAPADEASGVALASNIVVTFSEAVKSGTGNILLQTAAGTTIATWSAGSSPNLVFSGSTLTIDPSADLAYSTGYKVLIPAGSVLDLAGNPYAGTSSYNFTTLAPPNRAPVAADAAATTAEDTAKSGTLPAASDADGDPVSYAKASNPAHGSVTVSTGGAYTYTPAANYNGADSFAYTVSDGRGGSNTYTVALTVTPVNDAPVAAASSRSGAEDTAISGTVSGTDVDNATLTYSVVTLPVHGALTLGTNGAYTYTPQANFNGADAFTFRAFDGSASSNAATVSLTVTPVNDAPTAADGTASTAEDTTKSGTLPAATDVDGDPVSYAKASNPAHGSVTVTTNGAYTWTPAANYTGADSFTYTVSDGRGGSNTYTLTLSVTPVNDAPSASASSRSGPEDTPITGAASATDVDSATLTYSVVTLPAHGALALGFDGTYTYTPQANFNGADSFSFRAFDGTDYSNTATVSLTVTPVNDAPTASDGTASTDEDTAKSGMLPAASDVDGDPVSYAKLNNPAHGSATVTAGGAYTYTPAASYNGADSFTYTVSDGRGGSNTYTLALTVTPVNNPPVASNSSASGAEDTTLSGAVTATDIDSVTRSFSVVSLPVHGSVTLDPDGAFRYVPQRDFNGTDAFTFRAFDGTDYSNVATVSLTVTPVNDAPTAADAAASTAEDTAKNGTLPAATDVDGDAITYAKEGNPAHGSVVVTTAGAYTYTPASDYNGADGFTYTVSDGLGGSTTYTLALTVSPVNDAPIALAASGSSDEDSVIAGTVTATDIDSATLALSVVTAPAHGLLVLGGDGAYTYTPQADFNGADAFSFRAFDGSAYSNAATVSLTVTPVNDAPTAADATANTTEDTAKSGTLPAATDVDGDAITYAKASNPAHGSVVVTTAGVYTYTPASDYNGADSFTYTVSDGRGGSNTYTLALTVAPVNDAPAATNATMTGDEDTTILGTVTATDIDSATLAFSVMTAPAHGVLSLGSDGGYTYTPQTDFNGSDAFSFRAFDGAAYSNTATVALTVTPVNDAPTAADATASTTEDTAKSGTLPAATDVDGDPVAYAKGSDPAHGSATVTASGAYTYTPAPDYNGADSFTYTVSDGRGGSNTYTLALTVTPVNDAPIARNSNASADEDTTITGNALATDIDSATLAFSVVTAPVHGVLAMGGDGAYTYTPQTDFNGLDAFSFRASDGTADSGIATVALAVVPVNDPPTVVRPSPIVYVDTLEDDTFAVVSGQLAATDVDGDPLAYAIAGAVPVSGALSKVGAYGTLRLDPARGSYAFTPNDAAIEALKTPATETFELSVSDGRLGTTTVLSVEITGADDRTVFAGTTTLLVREDATLLATGKVTATDRDPGDAALLPQTDSAGTLGTFSVAADGTLTYRLDNASVAVQSLGRGETVVESFAVRAAGGASTEVQVVIEGANDAPALLAPIADRRGSPFTLPEATFGDVDGDTLAWSARLLGGQPLPAWLGFDPATRTFSGFPPGAQPETLKILVMATDPSGGSAQDDFTLTVQAPLVLIGTDARDTLVGSEEADTLRGLGGNDLLTGLQGDDSIDGGAGIDTAAYAVPRAQASIAVQSGATPYAATVLVPGLGTDALANVERLRFADVSVALDVTPTGNVDDPITKGVGGNAGKTYRLYQAAFARTPDLGGLGYWIAQVDDGAKLLDLASGFLGSPEFASKYGANPTNQEYTRALYLNVLGREPDANGYAYWSALLDGKPWNGVDYGSTTRQQMLVDFSEGSENKAHLIGIIGDGFDYTPWLP